MNKYVEDLIASLQLAPHPEGGYYRETYRSTEVMTPTTPMKGSASRAVSTAIYYLLLPDTFSEMHRLSADEIFHFYLGQTVELLQLFPDGTSVLTKLGQNLSAGETVQLVIPAGVWFGSRLTDGGGFALMGTTVAPGFDFADYVRGDRAELSARYPDRAVLIESLTR